MKLSTPHDALFKKTFGDPEHAVGEFKALLPKRLSQRIDWSTLTVEPGSFVDEQFRSVHSDLLYSVQLDGKSAHLFTLFEHQSTEDKLISFRLLSYMVEIWRRWLGRKENANAKYLPAIIPIVLFHGEKTWTSSRQFMDLMNLDDAIRAEISEYLPSFRFLLDDLSEVSDEVLKTRQLTPRAQLALALLGHLRYLSDLGAFFASWAPVLRDLAVSEEDRSALKFLVYYILRVGPENQPTLEKRMEEHLGETGREAVQTAGDLLIQEGFNRGIEKGIQRGIQEGIQKGELKTLSHSILRVLERRNMNVSPEDRARICACTDLSRLNLWFDRALDVDRAQDIFSDAN